MDFPKPIPDRRAYSDTRLQELRSAVADIEVLAHVRDLAIYATGSYARLEASAYSDIDLFFVHASSSLDRPTSSRVKTLLDADLIRLVDRLGYPPFSGDGEFLEVHHLGDIQENLGSRTDDYKNYFTARLLLLLESHPIAGDEAFEHNRKRIIESYYRDYHDHDTQFVPVFLLNDIIRFWKTMCLNYENRRNRPPDDLRRKHANHLKNLKLKFSRLLTCYSMVVALSNSEVPVQEDRVHEMASSTPLDRLVEAAAQIPDAKNDLQVALEKYGWFLEQTGRPKDDQLDWIGRRDQRDHAFTQAREFGDAIYRILRALEGQSQVFRYVVI